MSEGNAGWGGPRAADTVGGASAQAVPWVRFGFVATAVAAAYLVVIGIPTAIIANPLFHRMIPAGTWNYLAWAVPAALFGPLMATYLVAWPQACRVDRRLGAGGLLSFLAVGCPVCNKLVVLAVGMSGAIHYFGPLQPFLAVISAGLLTIALWSRLATRTRASRPGPQLEISAPLSSGYTPTRR